WRAPGGSALVSSRADGSAGQPETVLAWHRQVRYDCVQAYRLHDGQRVPRVPSFEHIGAELVQRDAKDVERILVVVHDQDVNVSEIDRTDLRSVGCHAGAPCAISGPTDSRK